MKSILILFLLCWISMMSSCFIGLGYRDHDRGRHEEHHEHHEEHHEHEEHR